MKKVLSILLAMLMLTSLGISGYAEADADLTTQLVLDRLTEGDEAAETPSDQAANGALRLAEMVVALDNLSIETQDEADHLNRILDKLAEIDVPEESLEHKVSMGAMKTFEALVIFQQQAVNGLYHSILAAALIVRGFCRDQGMVKQIEAELNAFNEADKSGTESVEDQLLLGSETLFRMLTATVSVLDAPGSYSEELQTLSENTYSADSEDEDPTYRLANWLYGCVYMTELIARVTQA